MKKLLIISLAVAVLGLVTLVSPNQSLAQGAAPSGSYKKTCKNIRVDDNGLYASCQKADGSWQDAGLSSVAFPCSEIENVDGELVCTSAE